jgi:Tol biopolymer transport system component
MLQLRSLFAAAALLAAAFLPSAAQAAFPGANGKIVFTSPRDPGNNHHVYVMEPDGSHQTALTGGELIDFQPAWSPDGQHIAFRSDRDAQPEVYVMNADGSNQTRLTTDPGEDVQPSWSPDGMRIAFASTRNGAHDIYVMNANGSNQTRLTTSPAHEFDPAWSPDGKKIAFDSTTTFGDGGGEVLVMNADGRLRRTSRTIPPTSRTPIGSRSPAHAPTSRSAWPWRRAASPRRRRDRACSPPTSRRG